MSSVLLLTRLQIMQTIGGVRAAIEKRTGANGAMVGTALISVLLIVGIGWLGYAAYGMVGALGLEKTIYGMLFLACGSLTFIFSLSSVLGSFFGSSDINDLLPLPVSPLAVVLSKALGAVASSYLWTLLLIAMPLLGWGIAAGAGIHYWIAYILAVVFTPFMPTAYSGTLAILIATVFKRVRRKDTITTITTVLTLALSIAAFFLSNRLSNGSNIVAALGGMSNTMGSAIMAFPAYGFAVHALQTADPLGMDMFVLLSVAAFAVFVLVARVFYLRIVTSLSAGGANAQAYDGTVVQEQSSVLKSLLRVEVNKVVRNSPILINYVVYTAVLTPVLLAVTLSTGSLSTLGEMFAELEGDVTTLASGWCISFAVLLVAFCNLNNRIALTCISREGSNWLYMKFIPVPMRTQLLAKTLVGFLVSAIVSVLFTGFTVYLLVILVHAEAIMPLYGLVIMLGLSWLTSCLGTWFDCKNPNVEWGNDGDVNAKTFRKNAGTMQSLLVGLVYAALPLLATVLTGLEPRVFLPIIAVASAAVAVLLGRMLLTSAARNMEAFD